MFHRLILIALAAGFTASCGGKKAQFSSYKLAELEVSRNSDGETADLDASMIYSSADAQADIDAVPPEEIASDEPLTEPASKENAATSQEPSTASAPADGTSSSVSSPQTPSEMETKSDETEGTADHKTSEKPEIKGTSNTDQLIQECKDALSIPDIPNESFVEEMIEDKNRNNQTLYRDDLSNNAPLLLRVHLKNVNMSTIELLNPSRTYCIDMQVKNMNKFEFKFHCDSKIAFINLKSKNGNNSKVMKVQCK